METSISFSLASTVLTQVRAKTRIGANPTATAFQDTAMLLQLNDVNEWAHNYPYTIGMLGWKFNDRETIINSKVNTTLNGAIASGATSMILLSSTNFDTPAANDLQAGFIRTSPYIYDFFSYETLSGSTLSVVSGLDTSHASGEPVSKLYHLPSQFGKTRALFRQSNIIEYSFLDQDMRQVPPFGYYMLKNFTSANGYNATFLLLPEFIGNYSFKLYYMIKANVIAATTDKINMPNGDGRQAIIEKMCAYVWSILGEESLAQLADAKAEAAMQSALGKYSMHTAQTNSSLQFLW